MALLNFNFHISLKHYFMFHILNNVKASCLSQYFLLMATFIMCLCLLGGVVTFSQPSTFFWCFQSPLLCNHSAGDGHELCPFRNIFSSSQQL